MKNIKIMLWKIPVPLIKYQIESENNTQVSRAIRNPVKYKTLGDQTSGYIITVIVNVKQTNFTH